MKTSCAIEARVRSKLRARTSLKWASGQAGLTGRFAAAARDLIQRDRSRDRNVERRDLPAHRNVDDMVGGLAHDLADALALGADHDRESAGHIKLVNRGVAARRERGNPV